MINIQFHAINLGTLGTLAPYCNQILLHYLSVLQKMFVKDLLNL